MNRKFPLARLAALIHERGPMRVVVAVGGDPDDVTTLTHGRIVLDPLSARPIYGWSAVREVRGFARVEAALAQDPEPCAVLWWPELRLGVSAADAEALLESLRDARRLHEMIAVARASQTALPPAGQ